MLEFIVLGEIPGTSIQISFWQFVELAALTAVLIIWRFEHRHTKTIRKSLQDVINRLAL